MEKNRKRLHIIANCAARKRVPPAVFLSSVLAIDIQESAKIWWDKLNNTSFLPTENKGLFCHSEGKVRAADLYIGSYWSIIRELPKIAQTVSLDSQLWIISAGYGLISAEDYIYSYSATFSGGDENSLNKIVNSTNNMEKSGSQWWNLLSTYSLPESTNPRNLSTLIKNHPNDFFLIIASSDYLSAIETDLLSGIKFLTSPENLIIVTSKLFSNNGLSKYLIPSDARLQCNSQCDAICDKHLIPKGVRGSISSSLAKVIIQNIHEWGFKVSTVKKIIEKAVENSPMLIQYDRTVLEDSEVKDFIDREIKISPSASASFLLRKLRDSGFACEQKRFKGFYSEVKRRKQ